MVSFSHNKQIRHDQYGWTLLVAGDNGFDLLKYEIKAASIVDAAHKSLELAELISHYSYENSKSTQITLRAWKVEVSLSTPTNAWYAASQEKLAAEIERLATRWTTADLA